MATNMKPTLDYTDRTLAANKKAMSAEFLRIGTLYAKFDKAGATIEKQSVLAVNLAREIGLHLQGICGHQQITFEFWHQNGCDKRLPFKFEKAKLFCSLARAMEEPAKTLNEAYNYVQTALVAGERLELPERTEAQHAAAIPIFERFLNSLALLAVPYKKITEMDTWTDGMLDKFLSETEWVVRERERAEDLKSKIVKVA